MSNPNTIDYSNLNKALQPRRGLANITEDVAKKIWDVFLAKNTKVKKEDAKTSKLNWLADMLENSSESVKTRFVITVNTLMDKWLLKADQIKKFKLIGTDWNKNLWNIMDELLSHLTDSEKELVDKSINEELDKYYEKIATKNDNMDELKEENNAIMAELDASERANEVVENSVLSRRSFNNSARIWYAMQKIYENPNLDDETKARKILWQAKKHVLWWMAWRPRVFSRLKDMNMKDTYNEIVDQLNAKMPSASDKGKIAMRSIMRQINRAYELYLRAIDVSKDTRRSNMRDINMAMAA